MDLSLRRQRSLVGHLRSLPSIDVYSHSLSLKVKKTEIREISVRVSPQVSSTAQMETLLLSNLLTIYLQSPALWPLWVQAMWHDTKQRSDLRVASFWLWRSWSQQVKDIMQLAQCPVPGYLSSAVGGWNLPAPMTFKSHWLPRDEHFF